MFKNMDLTTFLQQNVAVRKEETQKVSKHPESVHQKRKDFQCLYCAFTCYRKMKLNNHMKTVHSNIYHMSKSNENSKKGSKCLYWISSYDPRMPHQRDIINKNYHILAKDWKFAQLFTMNKFVSGNRRLPNLMETLSPTNVKRIWRVTLVKKT